MRSLSRGAGSKQCRHEPGRIFDFKNSQAFGRGVAEESVGW